MVNYRKNKCKGWTKYTKDIIAKDTTGAATEYKLTIKTSFKVNSNNYERDETELISRKWFKLDKALEMIRKSEITDALTQISIFFIWNYVNEVKSKQV